MSDLAYRLVTDGQWCENDSDGIVEVINPAAEQVIGRVRQALRMPSVRSLPPGGRSMTVRGRARRPWAERAC